MAQALTTLGTVRAVVAAAVAESTTSAQL